MSGGTHPFALGDETFQPHADEHVFAVRTAAVRKLERVPRGVPEVQALAHAALFRFVLRDDTRFEAHAVRRDLGEEGKVMKPPPACPQLFADGGVQKPRL